MKLYCVCAILLTLLTANLRANDLAPSTFFHGDHPLARCEPPSSFDDLSKWIDEVDTMSLNSTRPGPGKNDYQSKLGFIIRGSCFEGKRAEFRQNIIKKYEAAVRLALKQTARCYDLFGFSPLASVPALSKVVEIECKEFKKPLSAAAHTIAVQEAQFIEPFTHNKRLLAATVGRYRMEINHKDNMDIAVDTERFASFFVHELMHFTPSNNRAWHADITKVGSKNKEGCKNSIWKDRIYLMSAACFPEGVRGQQFFGERSWRKAGTEIIWEYKSPVLDCQGLCESAFMESDSEKDFVEKIMHSQGAYKMDRLYIAPRLSKSQATQYCDRVRAAARIKKNHVEHMARVETRLKDKILNRLNGLTTKKEAFLLEKDFKRYRDLIAEPAPREKVLKNLLALKRELTETIAQLCAKNNASCKPGNEPFRSFLEQGYSYVKKMNADRADVMQLFYAKDSSSESD